MRVRILSRRCEKPKLKLEFFVFGLENWDPNWHQMASYGSKLTFDKTDLDHFPARVFLYVPRKSDLGFLGTKKKNRWRIRSVKNFKNEFGGQMLQTSQTPTRRIFPRPPKLPKPSKHVSTIGFYVFLAWRVGWGHASFRTAGTVSQIGYGILSVLPLMVNSFTGCFPSLLFCWWAGVP